MNPNDEILDDGVIALETQPPIQWQSPAEIKTLIPSVMPLDNEIVPEPYRAWLMDVSHRMQTPPDFTAASSVVVTGSIIGSGCGIRPKARDNWEVIPNVWGACIGRPSVVLKSPSMGEVMRLLDKLQAKHGEIFQSEEKEREFDGLMREAVQKDIKVDITKAAKGKGVTRLLIWSRSQS